MSDDPSKIELPGTGEHAPERLLWEMIQQEFQRDWSAAIELYEGARVLEGWGEE